MQKGQKVTGMYFLIRGKLHVNYDNSSCTVDFEEKPTTSSLHARSTTPSEAFGKSFAEVIPNDTDVTEDERFKTVGGFLLQAPGYIAATSLFKEHVLPYTVSCTNHTELLK